MRPRREGGEGGRGRAWSVDGVAGNIHEGRKHFGLWNFGSPENRDCLKMAINTTSRENHGLQSLRVILDILLSVCCEIAKKGKFL